MAATLGSCACSLVLALLLPGSYISPAANVYVFWPVTWALVGYQDYGCAFGVDWKDGLEDPYRVQHAL